MKRCPDCAELLQPDARICRVCRFDFETGLSADGQSRDNDTPAEVAPPPRPLAMEMACEQLEGGHPKLALDQAFVAAGGGASHSSEYADGSHLRAIRWWHVTLIAVVAAGFALLAHATPLTYDEAFNRVYYDNLGIRAILRTYDYPNNHVPFTVLQSLIPHRLLTWDPWTIRLLGVASGIAMVAALIGVAAVRHTSPLLGLFVVAGSPILMSYVVVSRGYTFSAVLLVGAVALPVVLARRSPMLGGRSPMLGVCLGATGLALATWPLPTNAFFAPGWIIAVLAIWGLRAAIAGATVYAAAVTLMFAPIAGQVRTQSKIPWNGHERWWQWVGELVASMSLVPVCLILVGAVAVVALAREHRIRSLASFRAIGAGARLAVITFAMSMSWFVLVGSTHAVGLQLPFVRTAVPAMWIGVVAVVAAFPRGRLEYIAVALLVPGLVLAAVMWSRAVRDGDWEHVAHSSRNDVLDSTTPATIRNLPSIRADRIVCSFWDLWVCTLVAPNLARSGITATSAEIAYESSLGCALGSRRPPAPYQVSVYRQGKLLGVLCH
jgi:hypothetical protein